MRARSLAPAAAACLTIAAACAPGAPETRAPSRTALSCDDRARARPLCLRAAASRCASQRSDCEASCEPRLSTGNSEKDPGLRRDIEEARCRDGCGPAALACERSLLAQCPSLCVSDGGAMQPDEPADAG
jgi:hypothetical protein